MSVNPVTSNVKQASLSKVDEDPSEVIKDKASKKTEKKAFAIDFSHLSNPSARAVDDESDKLSDISASSVQKKKKKKKKKKGKAAP